MILLTKVEEVLEIEGRGCVLVPAISGSVPKDFVIRRADLIQLRKPDGSVVQTHIKAIEMIDYLGRTKRDYAVHKQSGKIGRAGSLLPAERGGWQATARTE